MNEAILVDEAARVMSIHLLQLTVVSIMAWTSVRLFARNRPHLAHTLWLLVIIKAITPPVATTNIGMFPWLERTVSTVARDLGSGSLETVHQYTEICELPNHTSRRNPAMKPTTSSTGQTDFAPIDERVRPSVMPARVQTPIVGPSTVQSEIRSLDNDVDQTVELLLLLFAWLAGSVVCFSMIVSRSARAISRIKSTRQPIPQWLANRMKLQSDRAGIKPRLWLTSSNFGPVAFGVLRPTIAIPSSLVQTNSSSTLNRDVDAILAHELAHVRRHDLFIGWLQAVAQSIWWFHPLIWIANRNLSRESERCCDEEAVGRLGCPATDYIKGLLNVLEAKRSLRAVPVHPGIRQVDVTRKRLERIISLKNGYRTKTPVWCSLFLLAASAFCIPGAASNTFTEKATSTRSPSFKLTPTLGPTGDQMPDEQIRLSVQLIYGPSAEVNDLFSNWNVKPFHDSNAPVLPRSSGQSIRKQTPVLWSPISESQYRQIVDAAQCETRINLLAATETVRGTQSLCLADITQHPFVVGMADEPIVSTVDSGFSIELIPNRIGTDDIRLQFKVELTRILEAERLTITRPGQSPTSIQIPKVARSNSTGRPTIDLNETLLIGGIRHLFADGHDGTAEATSDFAMIIAVKATALDQTPADAINAKNATPELHEWLEALNDSYKSPAGVPNDSAPPVSNHPDSIFAQSVNASPWDLSRIDCLKIALEQSHEAARLGNVVLGDGDSVGSIRLKGERARTDAEITIRHLVRGIEKAYWELYFCYRNLDAAKVGRDSALLTWRSVNAQLEEGSGNQADAASVAQSHEQYFFFRGRVEEAKRDLMKAENRLRFLCGIPGQDGRTIRPTDEPDYSKKNADWELLLAATILGAPEAQKARTLIKTITNSLATVTSEGERRELESLVKKRQRKLNDIELELSHLLTDAVQNLGSSHSLIETASLQSHAAEQHVDALQAKFAEGTVTLDFLLDAQRRLADSRVAYYRSLVNYEMAKLEVAYRSNSLLSDRKLTIIEPAGE